MTYALLLSIVMITGAVTTDAFAQSNTERLESIDDTTDAIQDAVDALTDAVSSLSDGIASILALLTSMNTTLDGVDTNVSTISSTVTQLGTTTSGLVSSVNSINTALDGVQTKIDSVSSAITSFGDIQASIMLLSAKVDNLETSLSSGDIASSVAANADAINTLSSQVVANNANLMDALNTIQARLGTIEASLGVVSEKVDRPVTTTTAPDGTYIETDSDKKVTTYDFARLGKEIKDGDYTYYDLNLSFTCTEDVRLRSAEVIKAVPDTSDYLTRDAGHDADPEVRPFGGSVNKPDRGVNYVKVEGTDLYNNWYALTPTNHEELNNEESFATRLLRAGDSLPFEARLYDGTFVKYNGNGSGYDGTGSTPPAANVLSDTEGKIVGDDRIVNTPTDNAFTSAIDKGHLAQLIQRDRDTAEDIYTIQVNWVSIKSGTQCSLNFGTGGSAIGFSNSITEIFTVHIEDPEATLKKFDTSLDCSGHPVRITEVKATPVGDWSNDFATLANLYLTIQDGVSDDTPDAHFRYVQDGTVAPQDDSSYDDLQYGNADLRLHGDIPPQISNLVISLKIDTIPDVDCTTSATP